MTVAPARILVVEDSRDLALGLRVNLEEQGYVVQVAYTISDARQRARQWQPHVMVLDLALPDGDGIDLLRDLRADGSEALVLVLTATARRDVKLRGLRTGADDYLTKPFDLEELLARVAGLLRRIRLDSAPPRASIERARVGDVDVDVPARTVSRGGRELPVSRIGFDLLVTLLARRGTVVPRKELMREVWGYRETVASRTLDTHVFELRRLIEADPSAPVHIRTVWRIGYRLD